MKLTRRKAGTQVHITQQHLNNIQHHSRFRGYLRDVGKVAGDTVPKCVTVEIER